MIVTDASAVLDLLLRSPVSGYVADLVLADDAELHAPATLDLEVVAVLRKWELSGRIAPARAEDALVFYLDQRIALHPPRPLLPRVWLLGRNVTAADGLYLALAEALDASLLTTDQRLAATVRKHTALEVIAPLMVA